MDSQDIAYLAGFTDGGGTITANFRKTAIGTPAVHPRMIIGNTNKEVLSWMQALWGGLLYLSDERDLRKHKPIYSIYWHGDNAVPVVEMILPYLCMKRRQAEILLELCKLSSRYKTVPEESLRRRAILVEEIKRLNYRGKSKELLPELSNGAQAALPCWSDAYFAGFVDEEGMIAAYSEDNSVDYLVNVSNTNTTVLKHIQRHLGGNFITCTRPRSVKHKQVYAVYWSGPNVVPVIGAALPYLKVKRRQAELVLQLRGLGMGTPHGVPPELRRKRKVIIEELAVLNHRGPKVSLGGGM